MKENPEKGVQGGGPVPVPSPRRKITVRDNSCSKSLRLMVDGGTNIPERLRDDEYLIRLKLESKEPIGSATEGPFYSGDDPELVGWIEDGGNVGKALVGPMIVFDVDEEQFGELLDDHLPPTFAVQTGSGGEHRYYHAPEWKENRKFTGGSIRTDGWQVAIPPSIHPNGQRYEVLHDRPIRSVGTEEIEAVASRAATESANTGGGRGGGAAPRVGGIPSLPSEYPNRPAEWGTLRKWLQSNGFLEELRLSSGDRSGREFKIAKCLAEGGFSETAIADVMDRFPHDSKWHERGEDYRQRTVRKAVIAACEDEYVEFDTPADMDRDRSERRKTEESGEGRTLQGGEQKMTDFTDKLEANILEGSEQGDSFRKAVLVEGNDNGETFEYVALKKGQIQEATTTDGEAVTIENVQDSVSLGSPEYLDELIDGLEALSEQLDED